MVRSMAIPGIIGTMLDAGQWPHRLDHPSLTGADQRLKTLEACHSLQTPSHGLDSRRRLTKVTRVDHTDSPDSVAVVAISLNI